jgi:protein-tyrosine phosphatase
MQKIIFICHGNICRSPMAEFIFKNMVEQRGLSDRFEVASAATSTDERGRDIYPPAQQILRENGIPFESRHARQITKADGEHYDLLICMDHNNLKNAKRILPEESHHKLHPFMEFAGEPRDVADPWYTRNFKKAYDDIIFGSNALLEKLINWKE